MRLTEWEAAEPVVLLLACLYVRTAFRICFAQCVRVSRREISVALERVAVLHEHGLCDAAAPRDGVERGVFGNTPQRG